MKNLICPVSDQQVNESVTRMNALLVIVLLGLTFVIHPLLPCLFLCVEYFVRAFTSFPASPLTRISAFLAKNTGLPGKMVDKAPKIFAARLGLLFVGMITLFHLLKLKTAATIVTALLMTLAGLESLLGLCMGCLVYTWVVFPAFARKPYSMKPDKRP